MSAERRRAPTIEKVERKSRPKPPDWKVLLQLPFRLTFRRESTGKRNWQVVLPKRLWDYSASPDDVTAVPSKTAQKIVDIAREARFVSAGEVFKAFGINPSSRLARRKLYDVCYKLRAEGLGQFLEETRGIRTITPRQMEVWELISAGLSNRQSGERLGLSEHTIKNQAHWLYQKLGIESPEPRTHAVEATVDAIHLGIFQTDDLIALRRRLK